MCQAGVLVVAVAAGVEAVGVLVALSRRHGRAQHQRQDPRQIRGHRSRLFTIDLLWWYRTGSVAGWNVEPGADIIGAGVRRAGVSKVLKVSRLTGDLDYLCFASKA